MTFSGVVLNCYLVVMDDSLAPLDRDRGFWAIFLDEPYRILVLFGCLQVAAFTEWQLYIYYLREI